jgi:hypothetical protein
MIKITHAPWRPTNKKGIGGQRIAIIGYSHHSDGDREGLTREVILGVIEGEYKIRFFTSIRKYFEFDDPEDFWGRVLFFNFLPERIGTKNEKYGTGSGEQTRKAIERTLRILAQEKPDKVLFFTTKGWRAFRETIEKSAGPLTPLLQKSPEPAWGRYTIGNHQVLICGFRHPQGAKTQDMRNQVRAFLALR